MGELDELDELEELGKQLNARQRKFCELLETGMSDVEAALEAGYGKGSKSSAAPIASKLLRKDNILAYRRALARDKWKRIGVTPDVVCLGVWEIFQRCMKAVPVEAWDYEQHQMIETGEYTFNSKGALAALKLIGGELGMFSRKVEVAGRMGIEGYLASLSESEQAAF